MKTLLQTLAVAFSLYSRIPMPRVEWNQKNMRYALGALPLVGAVIGLLLWGYGALCRWLGFSPLLQGAGLLLLPVLVTGGIHLDGLCDTCDALASQGDCQRKLDIMKDSHAGAFAVIGAACFFIAALALYGSLEITPAALWCLGLGQVCSRALAGVALCTLPCAKDSGLAHAFSCQADKAKLGGFLGLLLLGLLAGFWLAAGPWGLACAAAAGLFYFYYRSKALREFGGITGDLQGFFVELCQLVLLAVLVLGQYLW